jgi:hypothetical protein
MSLNTTIESPQGKTVTSYEFEPGQTIYVKVSDVSSEVLSLGHAYIGITFSNVTVEPMAVTHDLDLAGNYTAEFKLPDVATQGTITVTVNGLAQEQQVLNIGVGEVGQAPVTPSGPKNLATEVESIGKWVLIGIAAIGLIYVLNKAAPGIASGLAKTKKAIDQN